MITQAITLISYGHFDKVFLDDIAEGISQEYNFPVTIKEQHIDLSIFYDPSRRQYDANKLLKEIDSQILPDSLKTLGLFRVDLFIPILTFIFGQAFLNGRTGIASLFRLRNELYGMVENEELQIMRFKKVIIHELGHTFGLKHCHTPDCVMISSTYVEDIDLKSARLCIKCKSEIRIPLETNDKS
jgi:archaemetzincin